MRIDKERINFTLKKFDKAEIVDTGDPIWDKELRFTIHGRPITDGRPRYIKKTETFFNPEKEAMKKLFRPIYNSDETLSTITISKPMKVFMDVYYKPTKTFRKFMKEAEINGEKFWSIEKKDNDNAEKVHFDILTDLEFKVILDDNLIVENLTRKFISYDERAVIRIVYPSDPDKIHKVYKVAIEESSEWIYLGINYKYIAKMSAENFHDYLVKICRERSLHKNKRSFNRHIMKTLMRMTPDHLADVLMYGLGKGVKLKLTKLETIDAYLKCLHKILEGKDND